MSAISGVVLLTAPGIDVIIPVLVDLGAVAAFIDAFHEAGMIVAIRPNQAEVGISPAARVLETGLLSGQ